MNKLMIIVYFILQVRIISAKPLMFDVHHKVFNFKQINVLK